MTRTQHPESWYALMRADHLKPGQSRAFDVLDRTWLLFRNQRGEVGAIDRFCSHMGTSLEGAKVDGECIVCPFHSWQYDRQGQCRTIPGETKIPKTAHLESAPVKEHLGWIWIYNGEKPAFDLPDMPEYHSKRHGVISWSRRVETTPMTILENSGDAYHMKTVHGGNYEDYRFEVLKDDEHDYEFLLVYRAKMMGIEQKISVTHFFRGGAFALVTLDALGLRIRYMVCPVPTGPNESLLNFMIVYKKLPRIFGALSLAQRYVIDQIFYRAIMADREIWRRIRPDKQRAVIKQDAMVIRFRRYYQSQIAGKTRQPGFLAST